MKDKVDRLLDALLFGAIGAMIVSCITENRLLELVVFLAIAIYSYKKNWRG